MSAAVSVAAIGVGAFSLATPAHADEPYGLKTFSNHTTDISGIPYTVAGGHPDLNTTSFSVPRTLNGLGGRPVEQPKSTYVTPPLGFIGNPAAAPRCPLSQVPTAGSDAGPDTCPPGSLIGFVEATLNPAGGDNSAPGVASYSLYNLPPEHGYPAQFGFRIENGFPTLLSVFPLPRTESYGLTVGTPNIPAVNFSAADVNFCSYGVEGVGHAVGALNCKSPTGFVGSPFLSNPVDCAETHPAWSIAIDSQKHAGALLGLGVSDLTDPDWKTATDPAPAVTGCDALAFDPALAADPLQPGGGPVQADQPTGLRVALDFPQTNDPTTPAETEFDSSARQTPPPKDITVKLPAGLAISPSSADGLQGCSDQASDHAGDQVHYDNTKPVACPDAAKIGTATATTPLLAAYQPPEDAIVGPEPIHGDVYLLKPHPGDLPLGGSSDGKFRLLIQLENERYGVNIKLPGIATADKTTGQITTVFTDNPQLPASHLTVDLVSGPRAPLMTPVTCGNFTTSANFVPWGTPDVPDADKATSFNVGSGPNGSGCVAAPGQRPFAPALVAAGTENDLAGASSPFTLKLTRNDGEQEFSSLEATLPKGLAAKFAGVPYCSNAALGAAAGRSGGAEQANPSCPASRIGSVTVGAGPGTNPFLANGTAYLAGPYKGAPMSVAVITPAVAGPFDLGTVVVRNALYVDPETAQGRVVSDPFPKMLDGIPLKLRSIAVRLDRPNFTLNPTNCSALAVNATIKSTDGASANSSVPFQVAGCKNLGFRPDLKLSLKGATKRSGHPALKAVLNYPKGNYANIAKAVVSLPHSEFLAQNHIKTICTRVQFAAKACPAGSIYGYATATTPLLDAPLSGPVYLRSSSNPLPDLVAALHGQIDVDLVGRIDSKNGGIRTTFDAVPDAPVSKFVLTMQGGKKGLLENSKNLCASVNKAEVRFTAQNGMTANSTPVLSNSCKKKTVKKGKGKSAKGKAHNRTIAWLPGLGF